MTKDEIRELFRRVVPEIGEGLVSIEGVARLPGVHTLVIVKSHDQDIDGVGALLGPKGRRVLEVLGTLGGSIGIVHWWRDPRQQLEHALGALTAAKIEIDEAGAVTLHDPVFRHDPPAPDPADREEPRDAAFVHQFVALVAELLDRPITIRGDIAFRLWNPREIGHG